MKFNIIPAKTRKKRNKQTRKIRGLRKCVKCLRTKTLPNYDEESFVCDDCRIGNKRSYEDYAKEAIEYLSWKEKFPGTPACHKCRGFYPPYVISMEEGKPTCANCFLINEEEKKENVE